METRGRRGSPTSAVEVIANENGMGPGKGPGIFVNVFPCGDRAKLRHLASQVTRPWLARCTDQSVQPTYLELSFSTISSDFITC